MAVRPFMPLPQMKRENTPLLGLELFEKVRHQLVLVIESDEPGIAINGHHADVLGFAHAHLQRAAILAGGNAIAVEFHNERRFRQPLLHRREFPGFHHRRQIRRFGQRIRRTPKCREHRQCRGQ